MLWDKLLARALRFKPPRSIAALASAPTTRATAAQMYDAAATGWVRKEASCLSDFTGREPIFAQLKPLVAGGARVLDIGCGEGYVARRLRTMGAAQVVGVDISQEMVRTALPDCLIALPAWAGCVLMQRSEGPAQILPHYQLGCPPASLAGLRMPLPV